ncbi:MAG: thioredoxin [Vicinamibacterales bacterium]
MATSTDPNAAATVVACPACAKRNRVPDAAKGSPRCASCQTALPWSVAVHSAEHFGSVTAGATPVLVDLWAPWCGPCRQVSPLLDDLARHRAGRLKVVKVNVDEVPAVSQRYGVQGIPTLLLLRNGREVARQVGALPAAALQQWVDRSLATG